MRLYFDSFLSFCFLCTGIFFDIDEGAHSGYRAGPVRRYFISCTSHRKSYFRVEEIWVFNVW